MNAILWFFDRFIPDQSYHLGLIIRLIFPLHRISSFKPTAAIVTNISSVGRWWVLKSNIFGQKSTYLKEFFLKKSYEELQFVKKAKIVLSKSILDVKNQSNFFNS